MQAAQPVGCRHQRRLVFRQSQRVANVSARSLFRQFRKECGSSPLEFAKQIRLTRAKEMLERAEPDATVLSVAYRCGFQNAGHFARDFKLAFGELPSDTLKRSPRS
jgi:transcriptional regulator GlxA family with amidase domain